MKSKLYCVRDSVAAVCHEQVMVCSSDGHARRIFSESLANFPERIKPDLELICLGILLRDDDDYPFIAEDAIGRDRLKSFPYVVMYGNGTSPEVPTVIEPNFSSDK